MSRQSQISDATAVEGGSQRTEEEGQKSLNSHACRQDFFASNRKSQSDMDLR